MMTNQESLKKFSGVYTITTEGQMGHDNFGHSIPELLERRNVSVNSVNDLPESSTLSTLHLNHCSRQPDNMSPLPMHNRPLMGRRVGLSIDILIWIFFGFWVIVIESGIFPHVKRGFYCDDRSISMRFNGDTVSTGAILFTIILVYPILWAFEACYFVPMSLNSSRFLESSRRAWKWYKEFLYGMTLKLFVVDGIKILFSEFRPHFLDTCRPDAFQSCVAGEYVTNWKCTNDVDSSWFIGDAAKSFPSGHSSISFFEAIFMIWYLQMRTTKMRSQLLIPTIQASFLLFAFLCSLSRITDHRHHWWDVLFGAKIGIIFACFTCVFLCKNFKVKKVPNVETMSQDEIIDNHRHTSVRRLLSERTKDDLNEVVAP